MSSHHMGSHVLDARPDRIDLRDRVYQPPLVSLPHSFPSDDLVRKHLPSYHQSSKILDQGKEGACTGFGLAAVINFIEWERWIKTGQDESRKPAHVSPWMLYELARMYDEWPGEDYSGSSCRGAMRGWHQHGVCAEQFWGNRAVSRTRPREGWRSDAASRPLGAYYRVNAKSIADMQSAVVEAKAIFCSARVHEGWDLLKRDPISTVADQQPPMIEKSQRITGGHAFAIVGYTPHGFIVQNSWGKKWGMGGFALLRYDDWAENGNDAWVAAMGAPTLVSDEVRITAGRASPGTRAMASVSDVATTRDGVKIWSKDEAERHVVVFENNGRIGKRLVDAVDAADNVEMVVHELPAEAATKGVKHVLLYAHGGLNSEDKAFERVRVMGPWFEANGIHPIFINWRTSVLESLRNIVEDQLGSDPNRSEYGRAQGIGDIFDRIKDYGVDAWDRSIEAIAEKFVVKTAWEQMKQNAWAATLPNRGSRQIIEALARLRREYPGVSVHMIGHSAGTELFGHMLDHMEPSMPVSTLGLYAPACTVEFANTHLATAMKKKIISPGGMHVDMLSDTNEKDDSTGPYQKSLLYLISRALEDVRKMPVLGMEKLWGPFPGGNKERDEWLQLHFAPSHLKEIQKWNRHVDKLGITKAILEKPQTATRVVRGRKEYIPSSHGSFDNALDIVNLSIGRILGTDKPVKRVTDLRSL